MKSLKNVLSALAFIFAIGAVFAFSSPNTTEVSTKNAYLQGECQTVRQVDASCILTTSANPICNVEPSGLLPIGPATEIGATDCGTVFRQPTP